MEQDAEDSDFEIIDGPVLDSDEFVDSSEHLLDEVSEDVVGDIPVWDSEFDEVNTADSTTKKKKKKKKKRYY